MSGVLVVMGGWGWGAGGGGPTGRGPTLPSGGKNLSQCRGSTKWTHSSGVSPMEMRISHCVAIPPVFATTFAGLPAFPGLLPLPLPSDLDSLGG